MAKEEKRENHIKADFEGLGKFKEATGGGEPIPKGQKMTTQHRVMQPRDDKGQFTYNAANEHPLKYGPSRGQTIPPYLLIKDRGETPEKDNERIVHSDESGKKGIYNVSKKMTGYTVVQFINDCKQFFPEDVKISEKVGVGNGFRAQTKVSDTTFTQKMGKKSDVEKAAILDDYRGDVKSLTFTGDKKALDKAWRDYVNSGTTGGGAFSKALMPKASKTAKVTPKKSGPSTISSQPFDANMVSMAKNNYSRFSQVHHGQITALSKLALSVGVKLSPEKIAIAVASGKYNSFNDIANMVKKYAKNKKSK